jgi:hypothetical protein
MCCFNLPIDHVHSTRIFVGTRNGQQITVYSAALIGQRIEMVLPVRTRGAKGVEFIDMKAYPEFFTDCERAMVLGSRSKAPTTQIMASAGAAPYLEVQQVGDYKVSFAPSWVDLDRADPRVFQLSQRLKQVLTAHYPVGEYGFVIYKPDHSGEMHPLAYRHPVEPGARFFVPTRHEHGHAGPPDWDHNIYHQVFSEHVPADSQGEGFVPAGQAFEGAKKTGKPIPAELDLDRPLRRLVRRAAYPNGDLEFAPAAVQASAPLVGVAAGAAAAGGAAFAYLRRRQPAARRGADGLPPTPND